MGSLCSCLQPKDADDKDDGDLELVRRPGSKTTDTRVPEPVQDLTVEQSSSDAAPPTAVTLSWRAPANFSAPNDVSHYYIKVSSKISNKVLKELEVKGDTTRVEFSGKDALEPLQTYIFGVQALGSNRSTGDWNMVEGFVDWECRFPTCRRNRMRIEDRDRVYDFCSRDHKVAFDEKHCLYNGCTDPATFSVSPEPQFPLMRERCHFCSYDHYYRVLQTESGVQPGYFMEVEQGSPEFKTVEDHFKKKWVGVEKGRKTTPTLRQVLAIINPALEKKFADYKEYHLITKDKEQKLVKRYFFGTNLSCDLYTYQIPCGHQCRTCGIGGSQGGDVSSCGVCELALHGFGQYSMSGVTLDKNPQHSHDKAKMHMESLTYGLLMCEVACANARSFKQRTLSESEIHPEGYDAVKIKRTKSILKNSTDEVMVYRADAVCPRYILLYV